MGVLRMNKRQSGLSLAELILGIAVLIVVGTALLWSIVAFKKGDVIQLRNNQLHSAMKDLENELVKDCMGATWFSMTMSEINQPHPDYPNVRYDRIVKDID